ncbi:MAG: hypothetical protein RLZZ127_236 [Planctomycetota bacterium]
MTKNSWGSAGYETVTLRLAEGSDVQDITLVYERGLLASIRCQLRPLPAATTPDGLARHTGLEPTRLMGMDGQQRLVFATSVPQVFIVAAGTSDGLVPTIVTLAGYIAKAEKPWFPGYQFFPVDGLGEPQRTYLAPALALGIAADPVSVRLRERLEAAHAARVRAVATAPTPAALMAAIEGAPEEHRIAASDRLITEAESHFAAGRIASAVGRVLLVRRIHRSSGDFWNPWLPGGKTTMDRFAALIASACIRLSIEPAATPGADVLRRHVFAGIPALRLSQADATGMDWKVRIAEGGAFIPTDRPVRRAAMADNSSAVALWQARRAAREAERQRWAEVERVNRDHSGFTESVEASWSVTEAVDIGRVDGTTDTLRTKHYQSVKRTPWRDEAKFQRHAQAVAALAAIDAQADPPRPPDRVATTVQATERTWSGSITLKAEVVGTLKITTWTRDASVVPTAYSDQGLPTPEQAEAGPRDLLIAGFAKDVRAIQDGHATAAIERHVAALAEATPAQRNAEAAWFRLLMGVGPLPGDEVEIPNELRDRMSWPGPPPITRPWP